MLGIKPNGNVRLVIACGSIFCLAAGAIGAFGSLMMLGQQTQSQSEYESTLKRSTDNQKMALSEAKELAEAKANANLGEKTDQFVVKGINASNFFSKAEGVTKDLQEFKVPDRDVKIMDRHRNLVGYYDGSMICNLQKMCKKL